MIHEGERRWAPMTWSFSLHLLCGDPAGADFWEAKEKVTITASAAEAARKNTEPLVQR